MLSDRFYNNSDLNQSCLTLKPPKNLSDLFNQFNSFSSDINNTPENEINYIYYDIDQLQTLKEFSDIIAIFESKVTKNKTPPIDVSIPSYSYEFYPTEAKAGGTLIYTRNHLSY